jgi:hypothetical protein
LDTSKTRPVKLRESLVELESESADVLSLEEEGCKEQSRQKESNRDEDANKRDH